MEGGNTVFPHAHAGQVDGFFEIECPDSDAMASTPLSYVAYPGLNIIGN
jgi:hypothetical protein